MKKRKKLWAAAVAAAAIVTVWTYFSLETEEWTIRSDRIPAALDGLRIALVTDVHGREFGTNSEKLLEALRASRPDLIAVSGDLMDRFTDRTTVKPLLEGMVQIAPVYFVTGNHEWARDDTEDLLTWIQDFGVRILRNDYVVLGEGLVLAGAEDRNAYADQEQPAAFLSRVRKEVGGDPYVALLSHRNDNLGLWSHLDVDLVLSGHGHGGIIRLPWIGGLLGVDREFFPDDEYGLYYQGRTVQAVSRGLGGARLWNRPHLPVIVLNHP